VEPRPAADLEALIGSSAAATSAVFHEPPGTPAEQAIIDAVTATIIELAAC
jgi:hypothetical protein